MSGVGRAFSEPTPDPVSKPFRDFRCLKIRVEREESGLRRCEPSEVRSTKAREQSSYGVLALTVVVFTNTTA